MLREIKPFLPTHFKLEYLNDVDKKYIKLKSIVMVVYLMPYMSVYPCISVSSPVPPGVYILISAGSMVMLVGFFGCCGAVRESQCLLGSVSTNAHIPQEQHLN